MYTKDELLNTRVNKDEHRRMDEPGPMAVRPGSLDLTGPARRRETEVHASEMTTNTRGAALGTARASVPSIARAGGVAKGSHPLVTHGHMAGQETRAHPTLGSAGAGSSAAVITDKTELQGGGEPKPYHGQQVPVSPGMRSRISGDIGRLPENVVDSEQQPVRRP
jgi:hypothetical protein